ncbi:hypothetical protein CPB85DRAFT_1348013 [Mucidula mucida]|nr:hypothetical protein CPB85DRAFT_1348013 [Mucidula mucida]
MACCSDLPPELIALCILFIGDYRDAQANLRQSFLVCHAWLPPSQRQLFQIFRMLPMEKVIPFRDLILGAPHIGAYVREVFLYHRVSQEDHDRAMSDTSMLAWFSREYRVSRKEVSRHLRHPAVAKPAHIYGNPEHHAFLGQ